MINFGSLQFTEEAAAKLGFLDKQEKTKTTSEQPPLFGPQGKETAFAPYGYRSDGTPKGEGWLGKLPIPDTENEFATEYSVGVNINGRDVDIPTLVPTLTDEERDDVLNAISKNEFPSDVIMEKAIDFAKKRIDLGLSPYKETSPGSFKVAGSGVSVQTEKALIKAGVHPSQLDKEVERKLVDGKYKDTGKSQTEVFAEMFGEVVSKERERQQQQAFDKIWKARKQEEELIRKELELLKKQQQEKPNSFEIVAPSGKSYMVKGKREEEKQEVPQQESKPTTFEITAPNGKIYKVKGVK